MSFWYYIFTLVTFLFLGCNEQFTQSQGVDVSDLESSEGRKRRSSSSEVAESSYIEQEESYSSAESSAKSYSSSQITRSESSSSKELGTIPGAIQASVSSSVHVSSSKESTVSSSYRQASSSQEASSSVESETSSVDSYSSAYDYTDNTEVSSSLADESSQITALGDPNVVQFETVTCEMRSDGSGCASEAVPTATATITDERGVSISEKAYGNTPIKVTVSLAWGTEFYGWEKSDEVEIEQTGPLSCVVTSVSGSGTVRAIIKVHTSGFFLDNTIAAGPIGYRWTRIGSQIWMRDNVRVNTNKALMLVQGSEVLLYGLLYPWEEAKRVCPSGWHLPTEYEWSTLLKGITGLPEEEITDEANVGGLLKSSRGWINYQAENESPYQLDLVGSGSLDTTNWSYTLTGTGVVGDYWLDRQIISEENKSALYIRVYNEKKSVDKLVGNQSIGKAVRCILNE